MNAALEAVIELERLAVRCGAFESGSLDVYDVADLIEDVRIAIRRKMDKPPVSSLTMTINDDWAIVFTGPDGEVYKSIPGVETGTFTDSVHEFYLDHTELSGTKLEPMDKLLTPKSEDPS